jgi:hypothetical protein
VFGPCVPLLRQVSVELLEDALSRLPVRIVCSRSETQPDEKLVELTLHRMIGAGPVLAVVDFRHPDNTGTTAISQSPPDQAVRSALGEAQRMVDRYGASTILVIDPEGCFICPTRARRR